MPSKQDVVNSLYVPGKVKINVHLRFYPETGEFDFQLYKGGNLAPVLYEGLGSHDRTEPIGATRAEMLGMMQMILESVLHGIKNDPDRQVAGLITPAPAVIEALSKK